jgi:hypothetical protein
VLVRVQSEREMGAQNCRSLSLSLNSGNVDNLDIIAPGKRRREEETERYIISIEPPFLKISKEGVDSLD